MDKNFDDFTKELSSKDWSAVVDSISKNIEGKNTTEAMLIASLNANTAILREYHEWLNK